MSTRVAERPDAEHRAPVLRATGLSKAYRAETMLTQALDGVELTLDAGEFVSATDMAPCPDDEDDCPIYPPEGSYRFAVEVFQGGLDDLGVGPGSTLRLGGECVRA